MNGMESTMTHRITPHADTFVFGLVIRESRKSALHVRRRVDILREPVLSKVPQRLGTGD